MSSLTRPWLFHHKGSIRIKIYAQPGASKTAIVGEHGGAIKIRISSPPVDGAANDEILRLLSKILDIGRAQFSLVGGATSRNKTFDIVGSDLDSILNKLNESDLF